MAAFVIVILFVLIAVFATGFTYFAITHERHPEPVASAAHLR